MIKIRIVQNKNELEIASFKPKKLIIGPDIFVAVDPVTANTKNIAINSHWYVMFHLTAKRLNSFKVMFKIPYATIKVKNTNSTVFVDVNLERITLANA